MKVPLPQQEQKPSVPIQLLVQLLVPVQLQLHLMVLPQLLQLPPQPVQEVILLLLLLLQVEAPHHLVQPQVVMLHQQFTNQVAGRNLQLLAV